MRVHFITHVPFEGPAAIAGWASERGYAQSTSNLWDGDALPPLEQLDLLVVMGGPMGVGDEERFGWMAAEKRFIGKALEARKKVLGVCLGAQLMAESLGARVYKNSEREIGWYPVEFSAEARTGTAVGELPVSMEAFHWHGETFDLPNGAVRLASSAACLNQGFLWEDCALALQFHIESTPHSVSALVENCSDELTGGNYVMDAEALLSQGEPAYRKMNEVLFGALDKLTGG